MSVPHAVGIAQLYVGLTGGLLVRVQPRGASERPGQAGFPPPASRPGHRNLAAPLPFRSPLRGAADDERTLALEAQATALTAVVLLGSSRWALPGRRRARRKRPYLRAPPSSRRGDAPECARDAEPKRLNFPLPQRRRPASWFESSPRVRRAPHMRSIVVSKESQRPYPRWRPAGLRSLAD